MFAVPIQHDTEGETAQPEGKILDWSKGECEPIPGKTMPAIAMIERDYTKLYLYEEIRTRNGIVEDKNLISYGMPSLYTAKQACDAVMGLSTMTNGKVAVRAWRDLERKTGLSDLTKLAADRESERFTFEMVAIQPRETITSPTFTGSNQNRRFTPFSVSIEQLLPFRTVTGRQSFYLDHELMFECDEAMSIYKPILDFKPLKNPLGQTKEITLKFLTPHNKWSTHSMYFDSQQLLTLFRGGQTIWLNEKDAAEIGVRDNDWCEVYNRNGVVISRAVVSPRLPRGVIFMYHAQDRHINVPMSKISGTRGGTHNTPTRILMLSCAKLRRLFGMKIKAQVCIVMNLDNALVATSNPACVAACPSGAIYKREEDGVVLVSQDNCCGWRHCVPAFPYKKVYYNWKTNKAEKCTFYPEVIESARKEGISEAVLNAAKISPVYQLIKGWNLALPLHPENTGIISQVLQRLLDMRRGKVKRMNSYANFKALRVTFVLEDFANGRI